MLEDFIPPNCAFLGQKFPDKILSWNYQYFFLWLLPRRHWRRCCTSRSQKLLNIFENPKSKNVSPKNLGFFRPDTSCSRCHSHHGQQADEKATARASSDAPQSAISQLDRPLHARIEEITDDNPQRRVPGDLQTSYTHTYTQTITVFLTVWRLGWQYTSVRHLSLSIKKRLSLKIRVRFRVRDVVRVRVGIRVRVIFLHVRVFTHKSRIIFLQIRANCLALVLCDTFDTSISIVSTNVSIPVSKRSRYIAVPRYRQVSWRYQFRYHAVCNRIALLVLARWFLIRWRFYV